MPGKGVEPISDGEYIRSAGNTVLGADDKAGVAAIMEALTSALEEEAPHRTIKFCSPSARNPVCMGVNAPILASLRQKSRGA
jgi:tripeptide aminopeptidase